MLKTKFSIAITLIAALSLLLVPAVYAAEGSTTGSFGAASSTPDVTAIEIYPDQACLQPAVTSMDPQTEYYAKVDVSLANNIRHLNVVQVNLYYDSLGSHPTPPTSGNVHDCAILTWTNGSPPTWTYDFGTSTTWHLVNADCVPPSNMNTTSGSWVFAFIPGTVARENKGSAIWDAQGYAEVNPSKTDEAFVYGKDMNFYGEIDVAGTVDWGEVDLGLVFNDSPPNPKPDTGVSINYIANGTYYEDINSSATWTGSGETVTLVDCNTNNAPPVNPGEFALKADDTATLASAIVVKTSYAHMNDAGTITGESGVDVDTNSLWLSLSQTGIAPVTYSGAIHYQIISKP
jgi:hypothetical protein